MSQNNEELRHYGVVGMKWGVHRAAKRLYRAQDKGDRENEIKALGSLNKHRNKIANKLIKLQNKSYNLEQKRYKTIDKIQAKTNKLEQKTDELQEKMLTTTSEKKARKLSNKIKKLSIKSAEVTNDVAKVEAKIAKNEKLKSTYNMYLSSVSYTLISNGSEFIN